MTKGELDKIVSYWIPRLGLEQWEIKTKIEEFSPISHAAQCQRTTYYDTAVIRFQKWLLKKEPPDKVIWKLTSGGEISNKEIENTVVHELLHCKFAVLERSIEVGRPVLKKREFLMLNEAYESAEENTVDSLAHSLVNGCGMHRLDK